MISRRRDLPKGLVVIGSGYVALELRQLFHHLGSRVTPMQRGPGILKGYEPEIADVVHSAMSEQGMGFVTGASFSQVR